MKVVPLTVRAFCLALICAIARLSPAADSYDESIQAFLRENFDHKNSGMVVGIVDEHGVRTFAAGKLDNGTDDEVTADTVFEIGSVTKTFTALLLFEMAERGEVQRRGVVVLANQLSIHSSMLGWRILQRARLTGLDPVKMQPLREINGAGLALDVDKSSGSLLITKVLANSPAQKAGLLAGQTIRSIDGTPTANKKLADCVEMIRGSAGSRLTLELADAGKGLSNSVELTREKFLLDE